ncbi:hypothetical protein DUNSADRAFT_15990 [Dunaliella salina]|uniref:C-type lectin domain-containing protein n=1 Tax=Dunaliella salina TaxID=3046 RepID=A0ABQ7G4G5_DUNSA|nr:hypothetical protein DUNSADRAFT_15990 [Dunaliella salina]|eukprot:KAF5829495.1 hypothetical protein DUNSADRAFT_15990 [Dunaliella salina]
MLLPTTPTPASPALPSLQPPPTSPPSPPLPPSPSTLPSTSTSDQAPPPPIQSVEPVRYGGNEYQIFGLQEGDRKTFDEASMDCRSRGMALATIDSEGEHELALRKLVNEYFDFNAPSWSNLKFWVGYKEMGGSLVAVDGGLTSYIENRLGTSGSGTCVHGDKEFGELAPLPNSLETFAYGLCDQKLPYACEESPCSICDTCVESIRTGFTENHEFGDDQASALAEWSTYCGGQNEYTDAQCEEALIAISGSVKVAKRPAALCGLVGKCNFDDDCSIQVGGPVDVEDIAFW